jgi:hypothetical protein
MLLALASTAGVAQAHPLTMPLPFPPSMPIILPKNDNDILHPQSMFLHTHQYISHEKYVIGIGINSVSGPSTPAANAAAFSTVNANNTAQE